MHSAIGSHNNVSLLNPFPLFLTKGKRTKEAVQSQDEIKNNFIVSNDLELLSLMCFRHFEKGYKHNIANRRFKRIQQYKLYEEKNTAVSLVYLKRVSKPFLTAIHEHPGVFPLFEQENTARGSIHIVHRRTIMNIQQRWN